MLSCWVGDAFADAVKIKTVFGAKKVKGYNCFNSQVLGIISRQNTLLNWRVCTETTVDPNRLAKIEDVDFSDVTFRNRQIYNK